MTLLCAFDWGQKTKERYDERVTTLEKTTLKQTKDKSYKPKKGNSYLLIMWYNMWNAFMATGFKRKTLAVLFASWAFLGRSQKSNFTLELKPNLRSWLCWSCANSSVGAGQIRVQIHHLQLVKLPDWSVMVSQRQFQCMAGQQIAHTCTVIWGGVVTESLK